MQRLDRIATAVAALLIALLGFLPIANWIPGGLGAPRYRTVAVELVNGTVLVIGWRSWQ